MDLKAGSALVSAVDDTSVIVTRIADPASVLTCGGVPMRAKGETGDLVEADPQLLGGTLLGKRYVDEAGSVELLVTKPGSGSLAVNGEVLQVAVAKALPSSD